MIRASCRTLSDSDIFGIFCAGIFNLHWNRVIFIINIFEYFLKEVKGYQLFGVSICVLDIVTPILLPYTPQ